MAISAGRIKREYLEHWVDSSPFQTSATYERVGSGIEDMSRTRNMEVTSVKDITGDTEITITRGNETLSVTPFFCKIGSSLAEHIMDLDDTNAELDELLTTYVEVKRWTESGGTSEATRRDAYFEISDVGGNTDAMQMPFTLHLSGLTTKGTWDSATRTFTPTSI